MDRLRLAQLYNKVMNDDTKIKILNEIDINYCVSNEPSSVSINNTFLGYNLLHIAVMKSDLSLAQQLLNLGVDFLKQGTRDGKTPLHKAIIQKKFPENKSVWQIMGQLKKDKIVETLLSAQVKNDKKFNPKCKDGVSHLHIACMFNHAEAVEFFVKAGESVDEAVNKNSYKLAGYTALHFAVRYSTIEAVEILLRHGANIHCEDAKGRSPLHLMIDHLLFFTKFLTRGERALSIPYEQEVERLNAIVNTVLEKVGDEVFIDSAGLSAFHLACTLKDNSKARHYLDGNVDINQPVKSNDMGWTPAHFAACLNIETLTLLLQRGANLLCKNKTGSTALDLCLKNYSPALVSALLSSSGELMNILLSDASTKLTDALLAMNDCRRLEDFLNSLADVNVFVPFDSPLWPGYSILHLAVSMDEKIMPWEYFSSKTDFQEKLADLPKQYNCTEDEQAVYLERIDMCLAKGCNVSAQDADGLSPIHLAFKWHKTRLLGRLMKHCEQNVSDSRNLSLLHIACASGKLDAVRKFVEQGADVNARVSSAYEWHEEMYRLMDEIEPDAIELQANSTPLHAAAIFGHEDVVVYLIERGADVYAKDALGLTPIHLTMELSVFGNGATPALLDTPNLRDLESDAGLSHLHAAVFDGNGEAVTRLLQAGANPNKVIGEGLPGNVSRFAGETPIHLTRDNMNIVRSLINYGADVTAESPFDKYRTPLLEKLFESVIEQPFVEALKRDADTGPFDSCGMTRLHVACATFELEWTERLLEAGADPNAQVSCSDEGSRLTPLHLLLNYADFADPGMPRRRVVDLVKLMLRYGANVLLSNGDMTAMHVVYRAIRSREDEANNREAREKRALELIADLMLNKQEDYTANPEDRNGFSHFHFACVRNKVRIVEKFLDNGVDVNCSTYPFKNVETAGFTPLHFALRYGSAAVARLLMKRGADVRAEDCHGNTPLHSMISGGYLCRELIDLLLREGADINANNLQNETPIELLIRSNGFSHKYLKFFLDRGASIDIRKSTASGEGIIGLVVENAVSSEMDIILKTISEHCNVERAIKTDFYAIHNVVSVRKSELQRAIYLKTIQKFVEMGAELDERDLKGNTALYNAILFDNAEAVEALLLLGADLNLVEKINGSFSNVIRNNRFSRRLKSALLNHLWKVSHVGLGVVDSIRNANLENVDWTPNVGMIRRCQGELVKAKTTKISGSLTLGSFLSEYRAVIDYPMMSVVQREDVDTVFSKSNAIRQEFPELAGLLMMQYRKALVRMNLMGPAKNILISSNVDLPDLCLEEILKYFKNVELEFLVQESGEVSPPCKRQRVE